MSTKPLWRQREDALVLGAPLTVLPALAFVPTTVLLLLDPAFPHARVLGAIVIPLLFLAEITGLAKLSVSFRREFDVLTLFAGGTIVIFWAVAACSGVLLAIVISH